MKPFSRLVSFGLLVMDFAKAAFHLALGVAGIAVAVWLIVVSRELW